MQCYHNLAATATQYGPREALRSAQLAATNQDIDMANAIVIVHTSLYSQWGGVSICTFMWLLSGHAVVLAIGMYRYTSRHRYLSSSLDVPNIWALAWYVDSGRSLVIHSLFVDLCFFLRGMVRKYSGDRQRMPALRRSWRAVGGLEQCRNC